MQFTRRAIGRLAAALPLVHPGWSAAADAYPSRPVKLLVGYSAGGAVDLIARVLAQHLSTSLGQSVIVENRPGAGTNIAMRQVIDAPPDGYTLMLVANAAAANPSLFHPQPFDPVRDLTAIALVGRVPVVIAANAQSEVSSLTRLLALSKVKPGDIQFASPGNGSTPHLAVELFERAAGIRLTHVPYKGGQQALTDVIGGQLPLVAVNALEALPHIRSGKLRALAVLSPRRTAILPDTPTIAESGFPGFEASVWYGLVGPAKMPAPVVARLYGDVEKALAAPDVQARLAQGGGEVTPGPRDAFGRFLAAETARYRKLIADAHIRLD
jgi:tripartite-type tricarboxylate transporter receptor subunit TctC